ncbi:DNA polymerase III subunit alpha [Thermodesulfobacteriota bacterium]
MQHAGFVHLHVHSEYSLLDGANKIDRLLELAKEHKMPALAITDHGNMFGAIEFYTKALKSGIKPIIGCEIYVAEKGMLEKEGSRTANPNHHLILLCKNLTGYKNLCKLVSKAYIEGFYYRPRIDKELLSEHNEGLIALSACLGGEVSGNIIRNNYAAAKKAATFYKDLFDNERFYLELQHNKIPEQDIANRDLIKLSKELEIPLVATNDCHYPTKKDAYAHEVLLCIQTGKTMDDENRMRMQSDEFYVKSAEEMEESFSETPEAILNSVKIAERCNLELNLSEIHLPDFSISATPDKGEGAKESEHVDVIEYLKKLTYEGLKERLVGVKEKYPDSYDEKLKVYEERVETELKIIIEMGFPGYFLIVSDFINYAKDNDIPVGPGRGSAAGSLVAYSLKITEVDPIEYNLLFERFLNPERKSMPDIDVDFCMNRRDEVIKYVTNKYGKANVSQIITFGQMQAKGVIRDVGRALNIPYGEVDKIAKLVPTELNITLEKAIKSEPQLKQAITQREEVRKLMDVAKSLEGLKRHCSTHAAGIVISNRPLVEYLPLYKSTKDDEIVTQFSMKYVEKIGLVKFDFLGLKTLTVIDEAIKNIKSTKGIDIDINKIPLDDKNAFKLFVTGETTGVFQLESAGMKELMVKLKPENFEDIVALVALYRPGPLQSGMADDFITRKHKKGKMKSGMGLPAIEHILADTYGVIVYQEQVMQIASELAGYSMGDADILRRAMGKKDIEVMNTEIDKCILAAKKRGVNENKARKVFDTIAEFAKYGFNKSHSAAYALIAYQTAYLKANHTVEFMAALLSAEMSDTSKVVKFIMEAKEKGIDILPPDVNESNKDFTVIGNKIRFGLAAVKNVGQAAIESIIECRNEGDKFSSIYDFCRRVDLRKVNKRVLESLIKCGAFDSTDKKRSQLMQVYEDALGQGQSEQKDRELGQFALFMNTESSPQNSERYPEIEEFAESKILTFEKETLGFYVSGHPLSKHAKEIEKYSTVNSSTINTTKGSKDLKICGIITEVKEKITKKGDKMAFVTLEDLYGFLEVVVFSDIYDSAYSLLNSEAPILIKGDLDRNESSSKLIATEVVDLSHAEESAADLVEFDILKDDGTIEKLNKLKEIIIEHPGNIRAELVIRVDGKGTARIRMSDRYNLKPSKFLRGAAKSIFGYDVIKFKILSKKSKTSVVGA